MADGVRVNVEDGWVTFTTDEGDEFAIPESELVQLIGPAVRDHLVGLLRAAELPGLPKKRKPRKTHKPSQEAMELADLMRRGILYENPAATIANGWTDAKHRAWAADMDRLMRLDKRSPLEIRRVIGWLYQGQPGMAEDRRFVVLSPSSLRAKWDRIAAVRRTTSPADDRRWRQPDALEDRP